MSSFGVPMREKALEGSELSSVSAICTFTLENLAIISYFVRFAAFSYTALGTMPLTHSLKVSISVFNCLNVM